jgi:hypothetical protein
MDTDCQTDDDNYMLGVANGFCVASMPLILNIILQLAQQPQAPWMPWLVVLLGAVFPTSLAFIILHFSRWHPQWIGLKRIPLLLATSFLVYCADILFLCCFGALCTVIYTISTHGG